MDLYQGRGPRAEPAHELVRWILTEGRIEPSVRTQPTTSAIRTLRQRALPRLVSAGVPLWRVTLYAATLHPQVRGFGWRWWREGRLAEEVRIAQGMELSEEYLQSPMRRTIEQGSSCDDG